MILEKCGRQAIEDFRQSVIDDMIPLELQEHTGAGDMFWCNDWWTIELCTFWLNRQTYMDTPTSDYLKENCAQTKLGLLSEVEEKERELAWLEELKDFSDTLFICEVGRGTDILIASAVKQWKKIICYDSNELVIACVNRYWRDKLGLPIEASVRDTTYVDLAALRDCVVIAHRTRLGEQGKDILRNNRNIVAIVDGLMDYYTIPAPVL